MKKLYEFLIESVFKNNEWEHRGDYKYAYAVLTKLINGEPIKLGKTGESGLYKATPEQIEELKKISPTKCTSSDFDKIMKGSIKWTQIFKGDYSGFEKGLASGNKGNAFEGEFAENFHADYQSLLEKALHLKEGELDEYNAIIRGDENQKRPMIKKGKYIILSTKHDTVGESVVDVELKRDNVILSNNDTTYNLSLKCDRKVSFCNAGISLLLPEQSFNKYEKTGKFEPGKSGNLNGQDLLDLFNIDGNRLADVFIKYKNKQIVDDNIVDVTKQINNNILMEFIKSVVGYGYILVHKIGKITHIYDLQTEQDLNKFVGNNINYVKIYYGGPSGTAKKVDVEVDLKNVTITFNFRNKQGGLYPSQLMADYIIKH